MKKSIWLVAVIAGLLSCNKTNLNSGSTDNQQEKLSSLQVDQLIKDEVIKSGQFNWNKQPDHVIWSALQNRDLVLSVGYAPQNQSHDLSSTIHTIDIGENQWQQTRDALLQQILITEKQLNPSLTIDQLIAYDESVLPVVDVFVQNQATIAMLRKNATVRYAEPMGYEPNAGLFGVQQNIAQTSTSGCGSNNAEAGLTEPADYITISPGAKQSWNYAYHNIPAAWSRSSGAGKKIMVIDTGISPDQALFHSLLNSGNSNGRTLEKKVTLRKSAWLGLSYGSVETSVNDACGHGTSMIGAAASPRNTVGGATGVAYNSSIVSVRASVDVLIDESRENKGVSDAFVLAGNTASVNIVSMSMGRITSSSQLGDAVDYAYNKGKLIFCAAGTSFGWSSGWWGVVFPATKTNVNAVTGIKDNQKSRCDACHEGPEVDFVVVMEQSLNGRTAISTAQTGFPPSTVGGSSVATATAAGIAGLVWARNPAASREHVLNKMIEGSSYYPGKSANFGWGITNANAATE